MNYLYLSISVYQPNYYRAMRWVVGLLIGLLPVFAQAQTISGTVFRDFNSNGVKDNSTTLNEIGMGGVRVTAYNTTGAFSTSVLSSTVVATLGQYTLNVGNANRIKFTNLQVI